jgi:hypothetical protein
VKISSFPIKEWLSDEEISVKIKGETTEGKRYEIGSGQIPTGIK